MSGKKKLKLRSLYNTDKTKSRTYNENVEQNWFRYIKERCTSHEDKLESINFMKDEILPKIFARLKHEYYRTACRSSSFLIQYQTS